MKKYYLIIMFLIWATIAKAQTHNPDFNKDWANIEYRLKTLETNSVNTNFRLSQYKQKIVASRYLTSGGLVLNTTGTFLMFSNDGGDKTMGILLNATGLILHVSSFIINLESIKEFDMTDKNYDIMSVEDTKPTISRPNAQITY